MSRRTIRENIVSLLSSSGNFDQVKDGAARTFDARSPVVVVLSRGTEMRDLTRGRRGGQLTYRYSATLYIRCDSGQEADAEDALDALSAATIVLIRDAGYGVPGTDAAPDSAPLRIIDGTLYRAERIDIETEEYD